MGLENFKTDSVNKEPERVGLKDKFVEDNLCPICGEEGEYMMNNQWNCTTDSCDTLSWFNTSYKLDNARV